MIDVKIYDYMKAVLMQPLLRVRRASSMAMFGFGEWVPSKDYKENDCVVSTFCLHLQCPWRVIDKENSNIFFASYDMYVPNSSLEWTKDFNWDKIGNNLFDENRSKWMEENKNLYVKDVELYEWGDLRLELSNGHMIEVFANTSFKLTTDDSWGEELWRFFDNIEEKNLVMTGRGSMLS